MEYVLEVYQVNRDGSKEYTVQGFWDCECEKHYIHLSATEPTCELCHTHCDDQPDSRLTEILHLAFLTPRQAVNLSDAMVTVGLNPLPMP